MEVDRQGKIRLSRKEAMDPPQVGAAKESSGG